MVIYFVGNSLMDLEQLYCRLRTKGVILPDRQSDTAVTVHPASQRNGNFDEEPYEATFMY